MSVPIAEEFAALDGHVWLNCAHQGPLPACARAAAVEAAAWKAMPWELTAERFAGVPLRLKHTLGRLIGVPAEEIILANSASYGLHLIANGFPFAAGDEVLTMRGDFPSDILPWLRRERDGVVVRQLRPRGRVMQPDEIEAAIGPRTRLLCLTWVHSLSGWAIDLDAIGTLCRERGVAFVVNASQALGARPFDVTTMPIDALVSVGWKWLVGPYATGFCWLHKDLRRRLTCLQSYWLSILTGADLGREQLDLAIPEDAAASRWDVFATANFLAFHPLAASMEMLLAHGIDAIAAHDDALVGRLIDGLDRTRFGLTSPAAGPARSTLVFIEPPERDRAAGLQQGLAGRRIHVAHRAGALRFAPHLCNTEDDIDRALAALHALT
ncbi:MAG: aminotransferase class V-fold PLP-dependent enzyme [Rhodospirillales bacterium]